MVSPNKIIDPYGEELWDDEIVPEEIETVKHCKLVKTGYERNGHDCWGNLEWSSYKYVMIDGKEQKCWDGWYVVHDGKKVRKITIFPPVVNVKNKPK